MKSDKIVSKWLLTILFSIILIIVIGGVTRLTNSGLSMPFWDIIEILPPLSEEEWIEKFEEYKALSPDYKNQTIEEFKTIYWWEYIHRIIGRIIGILVIFPFFYFIYKGYLTNKQKIKYAIIGVLVAAQGIVGWLMVKSGLNVEIYAKSQGVSPFWLLIHLSLALITYSYVFFNYLDLNKKALINPSFRSLNVGKIIFIGIFFQIMLGALMSGFKAGITYPTFPLMNGEFYPSQGVFLDFRNADFIHFFHRWFPFFLLMIIIIIFLKVRDKISPTQKSIFKILFYTFIFQICLGIFTLLNPVIPFNWSADKIVIAAMHQFGSIILLTLSTILIFTFNNKSQ